jgi:hypothetical protein
MRKLTATVLTAMILMIVLVSCESWSTDSAQERMGYVIIPAYISYVEADTAYTEKAKSEILEAILGYSYVDACRIIIPEYMAYVENDPTISDAMKDALLTNARSYIYVNNHFEGRVIE